MYTLIITEKPSAANKIASALADGKPVKKNYLGVPYYDLSHGKKDIMVVPAVGHLFTVAEKQKSFKYPSFDIHWVPTSEVDKKSSYSKKYINAIKKLSAGAKDYIVACDYDIEGEVIGLNCIRYICKQKDAKRMKFSTLTKPDVMKAFEEAQPTLDWGQALAGETRHFLDWLYGINLSRALTLSVKSQGRYITLSSGRVQAPALKLIVDKEKEIKVFVPVPYWQLQLLGKLNGKAIEAWHQIDKFADEKICKQVLARVKGTDGTIKSVEKSQFEKSPPVPLDLTRLQTEAYRCLRIPPKTSLEIAQELYIAGYISYPRTSSQKLPSSIGYEKILKSIQQQPAYKELASKILKKTPLKPKEGEKSDPAHPAIYPTGISPKAISGSKAKIYDLIVRRFMAVFAEPSVRETIKLIIDVNSENFIAKGTRTIKDGWQEFYGLHVMFEEQFVPECKQGDLVRVDDIVKHDKETLPPKRFTPASIIKELEKRNLGTKSTRAAIVDTLQQRGYVQGQSLEATDLGIMITEVMAKFCPKIVDEELTRHFEEEMDEVREAKKQEKQILGEAKGVLTIILKDLKHHERELGKEIIDAHDESQQKSSTIGLCPECGGALVIKKGKFGRFIACDKYPDCKKTFKLPAAGLIKPSDKVCEHCNHPIISIIRAGKRPQMVCINPQCPGKRLEDAAAEKEAEAVENGKIEKKCPKCGGNMVIRSSVYGKFFGCSNYPKCRHTEKIEGNGNGKGSKDHSDKK